MVARTVNAAHYFLLREKTWAVRAGLEKRCIVNIGFQKMRACPVCCSEDLLNNPNNNYGSSQPEGGRKEEIHQGGANTVVRTVKETHNCMSR